MQSSAAVASSVALRPPMTARMRPSLRDVNGQRTACSTCKLHDKCLSTDLGTDSLEQFDTLISTHVRLRKGDTLYRAGAAFTALYGVRSGSFKTLSLTENGLEQIAGYQLAGDIIGLDGITSDSHECEAIALEDSEVCVIPFHEFEQIAGDDRQVQRNLYRLLAREITRERLQMIMLGTMHADQRLVTFLLDLSRRYQKLGYSASAFVLRMTRDEIGSYLGLKLETVSRVLSRLQAEGLIRVTGREIMLSNSQGLARILDRVD